MPILAFQLLFSDDNEGHFELQLGGLQRGRYFRNSSWHRQIQKFISHKNLKSTDDRWIFFGLNLYLKRYDLQIR